MSDRFAATTKALGALAARFGEDRRGATAIEYGMIASGIVIVIIAALTGYGEQINAQWNWIANTVLANVRSG